MSTKIHFDADKVEEAIEIVKRYYIVEKDYEFNLNMVPDSILKKYEFWLEILKFRPDLICTVPKEILEKPEFLSKIDRLKFYNYIPKQFLTEEDFYNSRKAEFGEVMEKNFPWKVESRNCYTWVKVGSKWFTPERLSDPDFGFKYIQYEGDIPDEYYSQELADKIWNSYLWIRKYRAIPKRFFRSEWKDIILLLNKRYLKFGYEDSIEITSSTGNYNALPMYYAQFETKKELMLAFELERKIRGNTYVADRFVIKDYIGDVYRELWNKLQVKDQEIADSLKDIYPEISLYIPEEFFKKEYLYPYLNSYIESYKSLAYDFKISTIKVEKLEIKEMMDYYFKTIKKILSVRYPEIDDQTVLTWINDSVRY